ncbi:isochorismatase hydrolase family protein [Pelomyxa schiedti]|nr:isochorismatase hydrolase family protein [Pelomyxa schiedti]KAH3746235.1 isochorismatase hydrolase family protein [Pelomyxa schiedti]
MSRGGPRWRMGYTSKEVGEMMEAVGPYARPMCGRWPSAEEKGRLALLVVDMQREYGPMAAAVAGNVAALVAACREKGIRVLYTQHGHEDLEEDGGMLYEFWGELPMRGSKAWQFIPEVQPLPSEHVVHKKTYSGFLNTDLEETLVSYGTTTLIIAGVLTNCCCETTARDAFNRGYRVVFVPDATATSSKDLHLSTLKTLAYGFTYMVPTAELLSALRSRY